MADYKSALKQKLVELRESEAARQAQQKKPLPKTLPAKAKAPAGVAEERGGPPKSDEELFLDAVRGVTKDVVLEKYSHAPPPQPPPKAPEERRRDDEALFEAFVGPVDRKRTVR